MATPALQSPKLIEQAATAAVAKRFAGTPGRHRFAAVPLDPRLRLARCHAALTAQLQGRIRGSVASVRVHCPADQGWTLYVQVRVHDYRSVLVTAGTIPAGDSITSAGLRRQTRDVTALGGDGSYFTRVDALASKVAARTLAPGTVITPSLLRRQTLVRRNETVRVIALAGAARIESQGVALQPGARDDLVRVRNSSSGRVVQGRVVAAGEVRVGG